MDGWLAAARSALHFLSLDAFFHVPRMNKGISYFKLYVNHFLLDIV